MEATPRFDSWPAQRAASEKRVADFLDVAVGAPRAEVATDEASAIYIEAVGEGWDFDGLTLEEFKTLPVEQLERAIDGYRRRITLH